MIHVPGRPSHKKIELQTRCGNDIDNRQEYDFSPSQLNRLPDYSRDYRGAKFRTQPNPIYNCHGMTFACARTMVFPESVQMILDDDGYAEVKNIDDVLPGDIVLYYEDNGEISHSGIVVSRPSEEPLKIPWVVSKWGMLNEVYHLVYDCPYHPSGGVRYWRITK